VADIRFLLTQDGKLFEEMLRRGEIGLVTSGVGSIVNGEVQPDFQLCAINVVPITRSRLQSKSASWWRFWKSIFLRVWQGPKRFARWIFTGA